AYLVTEPTGTDPRMSSIPARDAAAANLTSAPPLRTASGAAAVRAASESSRQRDVRSEAELAMPTDAEIGGAGVRTIGGRRFVRTDGVWIDAAHRADAGIVRIEPFSPLYFALLTDLPEVRGVWAAFGESIVAGRDVS